MDHTLVDTFKELTLIIGSGAIGGYITARFKLPTILGYIFAGIILSIAISVIGRDIRFDSEFISNIAEIGVALLLFSAGIEFSFKSISSIKKLVVFGSIIQTVLVILISFVLLPVVGLNSYEAFFVGVVTATSSTAFVLKMLEQREELSNQSSNIMIGWLIMQDIIIVVLFLLLANFAPNASESSNIFIPIIKGIIVVTVTLGLGKYVISPAMKEIAKLNSQEVLLISVVALSIGFAFFSEYMGISYTLGSFLTGLALSESFLQHEILSEVKPIRDLFTMIFFVSIGTFFSVSKAIDEIGVVLFVLFVILTLKVIIIFSINIFFKVHTKNAIKVALGISQIGEFAFVGISTGLKNGWINDSIYIAVLVATLISMSLTPLFYSLSDSLHKSMGHNVQKFSPYVYRKLFVNMRLPDKHTQSLKNHVIVCGYGRVGKYIVQALKAAKIKYVVLEIDSLLAQEATNQGHLTIYGDSTNIEILNRANLHEAKVVILALPQSIISKIGGFVQTIKTINPKIEIVVRTSLKEAPKTLKNETIIDPEFEAAMSIIRKLKNYVNVGNINVTEYVRKQRMSEVKEYVS